MVQGIGDHLQPPYLLGFRVPDPLRFRYELRESSEDSDKEKARTNACIQVRVFFVGCWTKSRNEKIEAKHFF